MINFFHKTQELMVEKINTDNRLLNEGSELFHIVKIEIMFYNITRWEIRSCGKVIG
jgi:hypothetical protein